MFPTPSMSKNRSSQVGEGCFFFFLGGGIKKTYRGVFWLVKRDDSLGGRNKINRSEFFWEGKK